MDTQDKAGPSRPSGEPCLDDKALYQVATRLGRDWVALAIELGITMTQVQTIETNHREGLIRQGLEMLVEWKQAQSTRIAEQVTALCTALKNIGRVDVSGYLHDISHNQETAKSGPDLLKICQKLLVSRYQAHARFIPELVSSSVLPPLGVDEFFIHLNLRQSRHQTIREDVKMSGQTKKLNRPETVPLDTWEDMYDEKKVGEKMVLLSGGAGFGKSTLCVTIANTWEKRKGSNVAKFELLFLLKLNQFKTSCIIQAIFDQLLQRTDKLTREDLKKVISDNADRVAFLMDGLDEIPQAILESSEGIYTIKDLLRNEVLLDSCVLVTTRPDMVSYATDCYRGYARVETKGFTVENRNKFIKAQFPHDVTSGEALISWLESLLALQALSQSPIIARMLCLLWPNRPDPSKPLPDKLTTVYSEFTEAQAKLRLSALSDGDEQQPNEKDLKRLGKVALKGLLDKERLHFSPQDFSKDTFLLNSGCKMGIMKRETVPSGLESVEVVTFLHKSHQEYCAACYLISLLDSKAQKFRKYLDEAVALGVSKVIYVLRFCCGLSERAADFILSRIGQGNDDLARLCLVESGSTKLASKLLKPRKILCEGQEYLAALYFYLQSGIKLNRTVFLIRCNSYAEVQVLGDILRCCKGDIRSMTIICALSDQGNEMLRLLAKTLQKADRELLSKKLIGIEVNIAYQSKYDVNCVFECISHLPNQLWTVSVFRISREDTCGLVDTLRGCVLHSVSVSEVDMHCHIAELVPLVTPALKELWLNVCELDDADVEGVVSLLPVGHGLTEIGIPGNAFSLDAVKTLAGHFHDLPKLNFFLCHSQGLDANNVQQVIQQDIPQLEENAKRTRRPFKCSSYEEVKQLTQTLLGGLVLPTSWIDLRYTVSERWREAMALLEETFGSLDERLRGQMELTVDVGNESVADVERLAGCISRLSTQVERFNLHMTGRSPSHVASLLNALTKGCSFSSLEVHETNMHGHVRDLAALVTPSLEELDLFLCSLDDDDIPDLIHILPAGQYLARLNASHNRFSLGAVEALATHLQSYQYLSKLELWTSELDGDLVKKVVDKHLPNVNKRRF